MPLAVTPVQDFRHGHPVLRGVGMKKLRRILVAVADLHHAHGRPAPQGGSAGAGNGGACGTVHAISDPLTQPRRIGRRLVPLQLTVEESLRVAQKDLERIARSKFLQGCRVQSSGSRGQTPHMGHCATSDCHSRGSYCQWYTPPRIYRSAGVAPHGLGTGASRTRSATTREIRPPVDQSCGPGGH